MTIATLKIGGMRRHQRLALVVISAGASLSILLFTAGWIGGLRINTTPSEPLGLWRIAQLTSPVRVGQTVFICPPENDVMREGRQRGYLRSGLCPGGFGPLIKTVVAVGGQRVEATDHITIDGVSLACSHIVDKDGQGRSLGHDDGGLVPSGSVYLHSDFVGSWDSRYFGPVPAIGILGLAQEVLTDAP